MTILTAVFAFATLAAVTAIFAMTILTAVFAFATLAAVTTVFLHRRLQLFVQHAAFFVCRASLHLLHTHLLVIAFALAFAARLLVLLFAFHKLFAKLVLCASLHRGFQLGAWFDIFLVPHIFLVSVLLFLVSVLVFHVLFLVSVLLFLVFVLAFHVLFLVFVLVFLVLHALLIHRLFIAIGILNPVLMKLPTALASFVVFAFTLTAVTAVFAFATLTTVIAIFAFTTLTAV